MRRAILAVATAALLVPASYVLADASPSPAPSPTATYTPPAAVDGTVQPTSTGIDGPQTTVCLIGDSITDPLTWRNDAHDPTSPYTGPIPYLADYLRQAGVAGTVWNFSIGGRGVVDGITAQPFLLRAMHCQVVLLELGQNDDPSGFGGRLARLVDDVQTWAPGASVVMSYMYIPVPPTVPWQIDAAAPKNNAVFTTYYPRWVSSGGGDTTVRAHVIGFFDAGRYNVSQCTTGIHLRPEGYPAYAWLWYDAMRAGLGLGPIPAPGSCLR